MRLYKYLKISLAKKFFPTHIQTASQRGILIMEKNTMKSLAYTLAILCGLNFVANAAEETAAPTTAPSEVVLEEAAVEVPAEAETEAK